MNDEEMKRLRGLMKDATNSRKASGDVSLKSSVKNAINPKIGQTIFMLPKKSINDKESEKKKKQSSSHESKIVDDGAKRIVDNDAMMIKKNIQKPPQVVRMSGVVGDRTHLSSSRMSSSSNNSQRSGQVNSGDFLSVGDKMNQHHSLNKVDAKSSQGNHFSSGGQQQLQQGKKNYLHPKIVSLLKDLMVNWEVGNEMLSASHYFASPFIGQGTEIYDPRSYNVSDETKSSKSENKGEGGEEEEEEDGSKTSRTAKNLELVIKTYDELRAMLPIPPSIFEEIRKKEAAAAASAAAAAAADASGVIDDKEKKPESINVHFLREDDLIRIVKLINNFEKNISQQNLLVLFKDALKNKGMKIDDFVEMVKVSKKFSNLHVDWVEKDAKEIVEILLKLAEIDVAEINRVSALLYKWEMDNVKENLSPSLNDLFTDSGLSVEMLRQSVDHVLQMKQDRLLEKIGKRLNELENLQSESDTQLFQLTNKFVDHQNHSNSVLAKVDSYQTRISDLSDQVTTCSKKLNENHKSIDRELKQIRDSFQRQINDIVVDRIETASTIEMMSHTCGNLRSSVSSEELFYVPWIQLKMRKPGRMLSLTALFIDTQFEVVSDRGDPFSESFEFQFEMTIRVPFRDLNIDAEDRNFPKTFLNRLLDEHTEIDKRFWSPLSVNAENLRNREVMFRATGQMFSDTHFKVIKDENGVFPVVKFRLEFLPPQKEFADLEANDYEDRDFFHHSPQWNFQWKYPCDLNLIVRRFNSYKKETQHLLVVNAEFQTFHNKTRFFFPSRVPAAIEATISDENDEKKQHSKPRLRQPPKHVAKLEPDADKTEHGRHARDLENQKEEQQQQQRQQFQQQQEIEQPEEEKEMQYGPTSEQMKQSENDTLSGAAVIDEPVQPHQVDGVDNNAFAEIGKQHPPITITPTDPSEFKSVSPSKIENEKALKETDEKKKNNQKPRVTASAVRTAGQIGTNRMKPLTNALASALAPKTVTQPQPDPFWDSVASNI